MKRRGVIFTGLNLVYFLLPMVFAVLVSGQLMGFFTNPTAYMASTLQKATQKITVEAFKIENMGIESQKVSFYLPPPPPGMVYKILSCEEADKRANTEVGLTTGGIALMILESAREIRKAFSKDTANTAKTGQKIATGTSKWVSFAKGTRRFLSATANKMRALKRALASLKKVRQLYNYIKRGVGKPWKFFKGLADNLVDALTTLDNSIGLRKIAAAAKEKLDNLKNLKNYKGSRVARKVGSTFEDLYLDSSLKERATVSSLTDNPWDVLYTKSGQVSKASMKPTEIASEMGGRYWTLQEIVMRMVNSLKFVLGKSLKAFETTFRIMKAVKPVAKTYTNMVDKLGYMYFVGFALALGRLKIVYPLEYHIVADLPHSEEILLRFRRGDPTQKDFMYTFGLFYLGLPEVVYLTPQTFGIFLFPFPDSEFVDMEFSSDGSSEDEYDQALQENRQRKLNCMMDMVRMATCQQDSFSSDCPILSQNTNIKEKLEGALKAVCRSRKLEKLYGAYSREMSVFLARFLDKYATPQGLGRSKLSLLSLQGTSLLPVNSRYETLSPMFVASALRYVYFDATGLRGDFEGKSLLQNFLGFLVCTVDTGEYLLLPEILDGESLQINGETVAFSREDFPSRKFGKGRDPYLDLAYVLSKLEGVVKDINKDREEGEQVGGVDELLTDMNSVKFLLCLFSPTLDPQNPPDFCKTVDDKTLEDVVNDVAGVTVDLADNGCNTCLDKNNLEETTDACQKCVENPRAFVYFYNAYQRNYKEFLDNWLSDDFQRILADNLVCQNYDERVGACRERVSRKVSTCNTRSDIKCAEAIYCFDSGSTVTDEKCEITVLDPNDGEEKKINLQEPFNFIAISEEEKKESICWARFTPDENKKHKDLAAFYQQLISEGGGAEVKARRFSVAGYVIKCTTSICSFAFPAVLDISSSEAIQQTFTIPLPGGSATFDGWSELSYEEFPLFIPNNVVVEHDSLFSDTLANILANSGIETYVASKVGTAAASFEKYFGFTLGDMPMYLSAVWTCPQSYKGWKYVEVCLVNKNTEEGELCFVAYTGADSGEIKEEPWLPGVKVTYYKGEDGKFHVVFEGAVTK